MELLGASACGRMAVGRMRQGCWIGCIVDLSRALDSFRSNCGREYVGRQSLPRQVVGWCLDRERASCDMGLLVASACVRMAMGRTQ